MVFKPLLGLWEFADAESGQPVLVDLSDKRFQAQFASMSLSREHELKRLLGSMDIDHIRIWLTEQKERQGANYVDDIVRFFKKRERRR